jgi:hypothetical protein
MKNFYRKYLKIVCIKVELHQNIHFFYEFLAHKSKKLNFTKKNPKSSKNPKSNLFLQILFEKIDFSTFIKNA